MSYLLYRVSYEDSILFNRTEVTLPNGYSFLFSRPSIKIIATKNAPVFRTIIYWLFHWLRLFKNRDFKIFIVYMGAEIAHYSMITPGDFRFPFMGENDLTIGDCWTTLNHRRKGLYTFVLQEIVRQMSESGRNIWTIINEDNIASFKAHEHAKFRRYGKVTRCKRLGINIFGYYKIIQRYRNYDP